MLDRYRFSSADYKSNFRNLVYSFFASRERSRDRCSQLRRQLREAEIRNQRLVNENRRLKQQLAASTAAATSATAHPQSTVSLESLLADRPLPGHQFGARMISFCCQLFKQIGFRAAEKVLPLIGSWLGVKMKTPTRGTIRNWCCRHGVAILQDSRQRADDWIWLVDHHVPIGNMVALVVLGIRQSDLPADRPLRREDVKPLAVIPGVSRKKEDVEKALLELAEEINPPLCIVVDGASELHEGVKAFENRGLDVVLMDDIKHKAANILKRLLGKQDRFAAFESNLGKTIASIQQTELDHFLPPKKRTKCRFMNLGKLIDWANMILHHHRYPDGAGLNGISLDRFNDKLGWLKAFENDIKQWSEIRQIISAVLKFSNRHGVYEGSVNDLKENLSASVITCDLARQVMQQLLASCQANEHKLLASSHCTLRLPCSTEVLESSLATYKHLQKHHTRGTFTSLLATYATLFSTSTPDTIKDHLCGVSTKLKNSWLRRKGLTNSTQTRKSAAYKAALG